MPTVLGCLGLMQKLNLHPCMFSNNLFISECASVDFCIQKLQNLWNDLNNSCDVNDASKLTIKILKYLFSIFS